MLLYSYNFNIPPASPYSNPFADELTFNAFPAAPKEVSPVPPLVVGKVPEDTLPAFNAVKFAPPPEKLVAVHTPEEILIPLEKLTAALPSSPLISEYK